MNKSLLQMVRQEVRRALKPTGLLGKRGPAKNVPVMVRRQVDSAKPRQILSLGLSE